MFDSCLLHRPIFSNLSLSFTLQHSLLKKGPLGVSCSVVDENSNPTLMSELFPLMLKGDILEDPANEPKKDMYMMSVDPEDAPNTPEYVLH